jgi:CO/xanthine dehydrogenase Mo-binding subunit
MVNTNSPVRAFWRCVNDPPGAFNYDIALDKLADKLGITPYQLRKTNLRPADAPDQDPPFYVWSGNGVGLCFERVYQASGYAHKWHKPGARILSDGRLHGIAITGHLDSHGSIARTIRGGIVTLTPDGKCLVNVGGARASDGSLTICAHIVAETIGLTYSDVSCNEWGNTDVSLDAGMQAGSTFTASAGAAFVEAAREARHKAFAAALSKEPFLSVKAAIEDLDAHDSFIFLRSDPTRGITFRQALSGAGPVGGTGAGWGPTLRSRPVGGVPLGSPCNSSGSAAACAEVAVDPETGEVEIMGIWNVVDSGRTIFKQGTFKQMLSGCELMIGQGLYYGDIYDHDSGALLNTTYAEALFPTTLDINTRSFYVEDVESDDSAGPYGAHGIGEPCVTNYSAIICAVFNATGRWVDPDKGGCTPNAVLKALGNG